MPPEDLETSSSKIEAFLERDTLNGAEMTALQDLLKEAGYEPGVSDGYFGAKTAGAIIDYMKDNPAALLQADDSRLREMMKYGQTDALRDLASDNKAAFDARIHEQLVEMGADKDISVLTRTTGYEAAYKLQTLLSIGGYNPGGLDGIIGNKTLNALERFEEEAVFPEALQVEPDSSAQEPTTSPSGNTRTATRNYSAYNSGNCCLAKCDQAL